MALILGVDGGNTKSIALVAQPDGTIIGAGRSGCTDIYGAASPAAAMAELERALDAALAQADSARSAITTACFSLAGADWPEDYAYLTAQITARGLASDFVVANDALGSLRAGVLDGVGVVAACGTGFATAARNAAGDFWHGSFWLEGLGGIELGRMALRAVVRAELGIEPPTALTAPLVAHFQQPDTESVLRLFTLNGQPHPTENDLGRLAPLFLRGAAVGYALARALIRDLPVQDGLVGGDPAQDVCQIALVERHRATGGVTNGFVHGFGFNAPCAVATTVAHDSHHMIVVGTDKANMALAANRLGEVGGGVVVYKDGRELALVELPIAGLMSDERAEVVAAKAARMVAAMADCGCTLNNAYMQLSLLALVVIPELRISDLGLVDVTRFEVVDLFVD